MRLIDADAICSGCPSYKDCHGECWSDGECEIYDVLIKSPTIEVQQWIPVTERLPEKHTIVLCYKGGQRRLGCYIGAEYGKGVAAFRHPKDQFAFGVTHWMPLPKPPMDGGAE